MNDTACITDEALATWAAGAMPEAEVAALNAHVAGCTTCRVVLAELARTTEARPQGEALGRYVLQEKLGAGGMGTVWAAWDPTLGRSVAVKILHEAHRDATQRAQRFIHERTILAGLEHPHIGHLLDAGETDEGRPYFVMERIDGDPIDLYCDRHHLAPIDRVKLMLPVLAAVSHAHQHLVVHRDLKPSNILVTQAGVPKLVDFGIARLLQEGAPVTATGVVPMTPAYASPEQVRREPAATSTDVYSLGVVLYELLSGTSPYPVPGRDIEALLRAVVEAEPGPCSAAAVRAGKGDKVRRAIEGDLDAVVAMALRKLPRDRYPSVGALERDLRAWLDGRPTDARKGSTAYRALKFVRRHRTAVAALATAFVALGAGLGATLWQARKAAIERDAAQHRFAQVRVLAHAVLFDYHDGIADLPGATAMRERLVNDGVAYLDSLAADARADFDLRREIAQAWLKIGDVQGDPYGASLGQTEKAGASYLKARALAQALLAEVPGDVGARRLLSASHDRYGAIREVSGDLPGAKAEYEKAYALDKAFVADHPGDLLQLNALARDLMSLGQTQSSLGDLEGAGKWFEESIGVRREVLKLQRDVPTRRGLAIANYSLAQVRLDMGRGAEAVKIAEEAEREASALVQENPKSVDLRRVQATIWGSLSSLYLSVDQADRAVEIAHRALAQAREALAADPKNSVARRDLVVSLNSLGMAQAAAKQLAAAAETQQEAIAVQRVSIADDPTNAQARRDLCQLLVSAADAALRREEWKAAEVGYRALRADTTALLKLEPDHLLTQEIHHASMDGLAQALAGRKAWAEAVAASREAISGMDALIAKNPDQKRLANRRAIWLSHQGQILMSQGCAAAKPVLLQAEAAFAALAQNDELLDQNKDARAAAAAAFAKCAKK